MGNESTTTKLLHFPVTRIIVGGAFCFVIMFAGITLLGAALPAGLVSEDLEDLLFNVWGGLLIILTYVFLYRNYENRKISELSAKGLGRNLGLGLLLGLGLISLTVAVIYLTGNMKVMNINPIAFMVPAVAIGIQSGVVEEILFRGILFRISEEWLGSYGALVISTLLFGAIHISNEGSNVIGIAVVIAAGLLLAAMYMHTRSLWLPIAFHFAWNFAQGGVYGAKVSGYDLPKSLLDTEIKGNTLITGGDFGPEGSVQAIVFVTVTFIAFMLLNKHNGQILPPSWRRRKQEVVVDETELPISS